MKITVVKDGAKPAEIDIVPDLNYVGQPAHMMWGLQQSERVLIMEAKRIHKALGDAIKEAERLDKPPMKPFWK